MASSASQVRQKLLEKLLDCVKKCQVRYGGRTELATGEEETIADLCRQLELVLNHGLRDQDTNLGLAVIRNVRDLVGGGEVAGRNLWNLLKSLLNSHEQQRFMLLSKISTDLGRGRAWIRSSLNEQSLERFLLSLLREKQKLNQIYEEWAFLRDDERSVLLPSMAAGLTSVRFAIRIDDPELNGELESVPQVFSNSLSSLLPVLKPSQPAKDPSQEIAQGSENDQVITTSKIRSKVKKKKLKSSSQVISFEDSISTPEQGEEAFPESPFSPFSSQPTDDSFLFGRKQEEPDDDFSSVPSREIRSPKRTDSFSSAVSSASEQTRERVQSLDFNYDPVRLKTEKQDAEPDDIDIYNQPYRTEESVDKPIKFLDALTPVTNKDVGALFPVHPGDSSRSSPPTMQQDEFDYTPTSNSLDTNSFNGITNLKLSVNNDNISNVSSCSGDSGRSNKSLGTEELRKALLSVMEKKEELEHQLKTLRSSLESEAVSNREIKTELENLNLKKQEQVEKLESRNSVLSRENELLKHQLKKYVGAVQKLRDGPQAYETLAKLESQNESNEINNKYVDYHFEASEYEKKLIQVAEMHGELLEFNECLQRGVQSRDGVINRLRHELVLLRGPLPEDQENWDTSSLASSEISVGNSRVLVNIWIPSVFLTGEGSNRHHVYQVYIRIRDSEWNIYRRYNQFLEFHLQTRRTDPVVSSFNFPPKKTVGNRSERFVESRRKQLQAYLRSIVNYLVSTDSSLSSSPEKETLIRLIPFFSDTPSPDTQPSRPSLLSRRSRESINRLNL